MSTPSERQDLSRPTGVQEASLATLSRHLGLSMATISRVLNNAPAARSIPHNTQERIRVAAHELGYRPNLLARSLRRGRSMTVGVLVPEMSEGFVSLVLAGLEETLSQAGYMFFLITHHHRKEVLARSRRMFGERAVDGIVAVDTALPIDDTIPTVTVSCPRMDEAATRIELDHQRAAELALTHLYELGHRSVAVIRGQPFSSDAQPRWESIRNTAAKLGLALRPELVVELQGDHPTDDPGYQATRSLLSCGTPFTAVFAFNDVSAIGAIRALRERGVAVPDDVSVVGFDDIRLAALHHPALTTVRQPLYTMGELAAKAILRRIDTPDGVFERVHVAQPEMVVRESTAVARQ